MKIRPLTDHVLVAVEKPDSKVGSLFLPQGARQMKLIKATVIAVGPGRWSESSGVRETIDLKPGDVVLVDDAIHTVQHFPTWRLDDYEQAQIAGGRPLHLLKADAIRGVDEEATASLAAAE